MDLTAEQITVGYGKQPVLEGLDLHLASGSFTGIVGPNGCGKSTLLKVLARWMRPWEGRVTLGGTDMRRLHTRQIARALAVLPQHPTAPPEVTVSELVASGRHPHLPRFGRFGEHDRQVLREVVAECELEDLADRKLGTLSGGQRQRAWLAMALAQEPRILLLDEPLSSLDINHQLEVMDLLTRLNATRGLTIGIVLHDLNLAARFCESLVFMQAGRIARQGPVDEALQASVVERVFHVRARIERDARTGRPHCHFDRAADADAVPAESRQGSAI